MYHLRTLGALSIHPEDPDREPLLADSKALALVAYVAATSGRRARRDHLADLFWPDADRSRGRQSLRQALYYLRTKLDESLLLSEGDELVLDESLLEVDLWALERAVRARAYERVVELYGGPFLEPFQARTGRELETWIEARTERVWTALKAALHQLVAGSLERGEPAEAVRYARRYVELNPLDDSARTALVRALAAADRPVEAIQAYESHRTLLAEELGDRPGDELRDVADDLRKRVFELPGIESDGGAADGARASSDRRSTSAADPNDLRPLVAAALVLLVLVPVMDGGLPGAAPVESAPPDAAPVAHLVRGGDRPNVRVLAAADSVRLEVAGRSETTLPSPTGDRVALAHRSPEGMNLAVREADTGSLSILTTLPHDENPVAWSPDGRYLVYRNGWMGPDGVHYERRLRVRDMESGEDRRVSDVPLAPRSGAAWSPRGTSIAFAGLSEEGDEDIWIARPDGSDPRTVATGPDRDAEPDFSPDGRWIAYASGPVGGRSIFLVRSEGGRTIPLVDTGFDDHDPVWRTDSRLLFLSSRDGRTELWEHDMSRDRSRRISADEGYGRLIPDPRRYGRAWVETVRIAPRPDVAATGQWLSLRAEGRTPDGTQTGGLDDEVRWSTPTADVLRSVRGPLFRVVGPGDGVVVATIPGWRSDTLRFAARAVSLRDRPVLLAEDWSDELDGGRWHTLGAPVPDVVERPGRFGRGLRNNGDEHFDSGITSVGAFATDDGLTLEGWVRAPMTGRHYQKVVMGFDPAPDPPGTEEWSDGRSPILVTVSGHPERVRYAVNGRELPIPPSDSLDSWRRLAVQLRPDGRTSMVLDGRILWSAPPPSGYTAGSDVHVVIGGRTVGTDILVGPVTLYRGLRYVVQ